MVSSDVEKLREVVQSLETEASNMNAFNGVLNSLKATNEEILAAKREVLQLAGEQRLFISKTEEKMDSFGKRISELEGSLLQLREEMLLEKDFLKTQKATEKSLSNLIEEYRQETEDLLKAKSKDIMGLNAATALLYIITTLLIF